MMHRLFAALPVPGAIADRLVPLRADLYGARWRWREHFHITLHFYGELRHEIAEEIADALERVRAPSLELEVQGVGWFGRKQPYSLYARISENAALSQLAADCKTIARELGLKLEAKPFTPHITLAYCVDTPLADVMRWSEDFQLLKTQPFLSDTFHLYESFTRPNKPSRYEAQADYPLQG